MKTQQYVFEGTWQVTVIESDQSAREELTTQLVAAKDFQTAFFKARRWAKENCSGQLVSLIQKDDMVV